MDDFTKFCDYFLSCVVGRSSYKQNMAAMTITDLATSSDEAFAILCIENNIDVWEYNCAIEKAKQSVEPLPEDERSKKPVPKYTGNSVEDTGGKHQGWSEEGISRFNELHNSIESKRLNTVQLEEDFRNQKMQEKLQGKKRKRILNPRTFVTAVTDLDRLHPSSADLHWEEDNQE